MRNILSPTEMCSN